MKLAIFFQHILKAAEESGKTIPEIMRILKAEGLEGVEYNILNVDEAMIETLDKAGLAISSIYAYVPLYLGNSEDGITLVDKARASGCSTVMVVPGSYPAEMEKEEALEKSMNPLRKIAEYGAEKGVTVTIEDYDGGAQTLFSTSADMRLFGESIPELFYTYDSGNFYTVEDPLAAFDALKHKIRHVHLKDHSHSPFSGCAAYRTARSGDILYDAPFGSGELPAAEILTKLRAIGYSGWLCLEHNGIPMQRANLSALSYTKNRIIR